MAQLTVRDFRSQMAAAFDRVDAGEEQTVTPELAAKIEQARKEFREGKTISLKSHEDVDRYFESM